MKDDRVGKQQLDQADVLKIMGQLVDHVSGCRVKRLQLGKPGFGQFLAARLGEFGGRFRIGKVAAHMALPPFQPRDLFAHQSKFTSTKYLAMAAQNLLGQRRARARHAQHKHGQA